MNDAESLCVGLAILMRSGFPPTEVYPGRDIIVFYPKPGSGIPEVFEGSAELGQLNHWQFSKDHGTWAFLT